jgi:succinate dehydrogenase / fumarate reductase, membrane anchor subunit
MKLLELFSWGSSPRKDWLWQRISACVFLIYAVIVLGYWYCNPNISFVGWHNFILSMPLRILGLLALTSLIIHAWIGLWTVITDYAKGKLISKILLTIVVILLLLYMGVGIFLLWGI